MPGMPWDPSGQLMVFLKSAHSFGLRLRWVWSVLRGRVWRQSGARSMYVWMVVVIIYSHKYDCIAVSTRTCVGPPWTYVNVNVNVWCLWTMQSR